MALKAIIEKIEDVPEALRTEYVDRDGKLVLDVEAVSGFALEDVTGLKGTLSKEMTKRKELEKTIVKFKDIDPDKAREALLKYDELMNFDPKTEAGKLVDAKVEAVRSQLVTAHTKEIGERDTRISGLTKSVETLLIDQAATAALATAKGAVELLLPHVQKHTRVREQDGRHIVEVIDKDGNVRIGNGKGEPMTIEGLVQEMRQSDAFGRAFEGDGQSGGGTPPKGPGGTPPNLGTIKKRSDLKTRQDRAAYVDKNGHAAYFALPA